LEQAMNGRYFLLGGVVATGVLVLAGACSDDPPLVGTGGQGTGNTGNGASGAGTGAMGGSDVIPNNCDAYCNTILETCGLGNEQYANEDDCSSYCEFLPKGDPGDLSGNSLACRNHWLALADDSPEAEYNNCRFAGPFTQGQCVNNCTMFCDAQAQYCNIEGQTQQFESTEECLDVCGDWLDDGNYFIDAEYDTFACRAKYLVMAVRDPLNNCQHIRETENCVGMPGMGGMGGMGGIGGIGGMGGMMMGGMGGMMMGGMGGMGGGLGGGGAGGT
jgi:hypothetical protein